MAAVSQKSEPVSRLDLFLHFFRRAGRAILPRRVGATISDSALFCRRLKLTGSETGVPTISH